MPSAEKDAGPVTDVEAQQLARAVMQASAEGCTCPYAVRSYGRVYDQDMGRGPVRVTTGRDCPIHGDNRVIPPEGGSDA